MNRYTYTLLTVIVFLMITAGWVSAHCQMPCGIYVDETQFALMLEDVTTIEKSITQITSLSKEKNINYNQIVRWVNNKETHADKLSEIITSYFMTQRIKAVSKENNAEYEKYIKEISLLHQMLVDTMKTKQTTDLENCTKLRRLIGEFKSIYIK